MSLFDEPEFRDALRDVEQTRDDLVSRLRATHAQLTREFEQHKKEKAERDKQRAAAARRGEYGPERQQLQRRIDAGETTWADVRSGRDTHPSAVAVRGFIDRNLEALAEHMKTDPDFQEAQEEMRAEAERYGPTE